jgi:3',5'-cyclic AMP phosphodiesterase CpdA
MAARRPPFRIVQLTDLHLTARDQDERSEPKIFRRKLSGMNAAFRRLLAAPGVKSADLVLVTGDVADRGDLAAWKVFWSGVRQAGIRRVLVVPGNHDVCCLGARLPSAGDGYRKDDLAKAIAGLTLGGVRQLKFPWVERPDERVAVIGLNSNNLGNFTAITNAMGSLGFHQLSSLASKLHVVRDVPVKIIALHHSPNIPAEQVELKRGLKPFTGLQRLGHQIKEAQARGLQLLSITHRVRLVLHGHLHRAELRRFGGIRFVGGPASTEPMAVPGGKPGLYCFVHTVLGDGGRVLSKLEWVCG